MLQEKLNTQMKTNDHITFTSAVKTKGNIFSMTFFVTEVVTSHLSNVINMYYLVDYQVLIRFAMSRFLSSLYTQTCIRAPLVGLIQGPSKETPLKRKWYNPKNT